MSLFHRRVVLAALAVVAMLATLTAMRIGEPPQYVIRITLGLTDKEETNWNGQVAVSGGQVTSLSGWHFENQDAVSGTSGWKCRTHNHIAPGHSFPIQPPPGKPRQPAVLATWPIGVTMIVHGDKPAVTIKLPKGEIKFQAAEVLLGEPKRYFDGAVTLARVPESGLLRPAEPLPTEGKRQDDYPAFWVRYKTNKHYLAWVSYQQGKDRVMLVERDGPHGTWSEPIEVAGPGDHFRVALASTHDDNLWIVWSNQRDKNWDLFGRAYKDGKLGPEVRLTNAPGPDIWHAMTTDRRGRAWLVWQGFRNGQSDIFARCYDDAGWHEPIQVSTSKANDWEPAITADTKEDRVWIGWDTYDTGTYGVRVRSISGGPKGELGEVQTPEASPFFGAHANLACDRDGRLWVTWDEAGQQWGKDGGYLYPNSTGTKLYTSRRVRVKILDNGHWLEPAAKFDDVLPAGMKEFNQYGQLQPDSDGRMWMTFRHRTSRNPRADAWAASGGWEIYATAYLGDRWLPPIPLDHSIGRNDAQTSPQRDRDGNVFFAYSSDNRPWLPPGMAPRNYTIAVSMLTGAAKPGAMKLAQPRSVPLAVATVHPKEKEQVARIRDYKVNVGGRTFRVYRGDIHRHTDLSTDGIGDGSITDLHRYGLDAAAMDYIFVTDHNMGGDNEYNWWRTQKFNDLYTIPGTFISMYGYERSVPYPNGHRNVIWAERGHRALPLPRAGIPKQMAEDTQKLYDYLRRTDGICTLHTSATGQGTDWNEKIDPALEPFVEIFQGFHASMEAPGAPRIVDAESDIIHTSFKPDGYVSYALDKGYRLGFQASSDHIATHVSYACILTDDFSRKGLVEAMKKRHSYAATDNIVLNVRMGSHMMGDELRTNRPAFDVEALGTSAIDRVDVIRNGKTVYTAPAGKNAEVASFHWEDPAPVKGEKPSYYYVRVLQKDGQLAWSSPMWVHVTE